MVEPVAIGVVLVGVAFLLFGAAFSSYGVSALGLTVGAGSGYLLAPTVADTFAVSSLLATGGSIVVGAIVGILLGYALLSLAVGLIAFVLGTYVGLTVVAGYIVEGGGNVEIVVAVGFGLVLALLGTILTKTMMVLLTSFVGAALASRSVTPSAIETAGTDLTIDPLLFDISPLVIGLFVVGVLVQFGLIRLGYVTRLLGILPGVRPLRDRGRES